MNNLKSKTLKNAYITPTQQFGNAKPFNLTGCVYSENFSRIPLSERSCGNDGDFYINKNSNTLDINIYPSPTNLSGNSIYLGHFMTHYGHFITETISTFWQLLSNHEYDYYIFQLFENKKCIPDYALSVFNFFNIPISKVIIIDGFYQCEKLLIVERLVQLNREIKPEMRKVYSFIQKKSAGYYQRQLPRKIYLSRTKNSLKKYNRAILNEVLLEDYFSQNGFEVIYPEFLGLTEQIQLFQHVDLIIGLSGSALHNIVFMKKDAKLYEIGDIRSNNAPHPMQILCNKISISTHYFIPYKGMIINQKMRIGIVDILFIKKQFSNLLNLEMAIKPSLLLRIKSICIGIFIFLKSCRP